MNDPTPLHRAARAALAHLELLAGFQESPSLLIVELREGLGVDAEITNQKGKDMTPFEKIQADTMAQIAAMPDGRDREETPNKRTTLMDENKPDGMLAYSLAIQNPSRDDPSWPLPSFDARDWAESFCKIAEANGHPGIDEGWMISWFANALMRGFDEHAMRAARTSAQSPE